MGDNPSTGLQQLAGTEVQQFFLEHYVGSGKIGHVYRGYDKQLPDTKVAIKIISQARLKAGWENELKKVSKLGLVQGVAHYRTHGTGIITLNETKELCLYTVWDYVPPGENLREYLRRTTGVDTGFLLAVIEQVLKVLHECQKCGVPRHGDLHCGNILIGNEEIESLDDALQPRKPIFVSDFGYGISGGGKEPKDDYAGLANIINDVIEHIDYGKETATHKQILLSIKELFSQVLPNAQYKSIPPLDLLRRLSEIKDHARSSQVALLPASSGATTTTITEEKKTDGSAVGQFQVSEMIGERWDWWKKLFVPTFPARFKILSLDIPTVVTGPRGCGKTMLFRRLSERLVVECGPVDSLPEQVKFAALYINANDIADAFSHFPETPSAAESGRLVCYANLCVLSDLLAVQSALSRATGERNDTALLGYVRRHLVTQPETDLLQGEDRLERYRTLLESIKWRFPSSPDAGNFPGYEEMAQHRWLPRFAREIRSLCQWVGDRAIILFVDDYSTPRVTESMQRVLNRLFLQRSSDFLAKISTEAWTTFIPQDSSSKNLQDGDDYQMVDMGEESLFLPDSERLAFLNEVFVRRLAVDPRIPKDVSSLFQLLGRMPLSKTEFARRLRMLRSEQTEEERPPVGASQRRGRSRSRVNYYGDEILAGLWSGDTRTMIQLVSDLVDQASDANLSAPRLELPVGESIQDRVFRNRGGEWLDSHVRNEPTNPGRFNAALQEIRAQKSTYKLTGHYGDHLKAIVEAFVTAASSLLNGPMYRIREGDTVREVPRMAFRLEIVDEFRISGLAEEIYRDLIRYGLFMRDSRGKSVRGAFVPRLYLRRLLLPYSTLALSKRDSVPVSCAAFNQLLLEPDEFRKSLPLNNRKRKSEPEQITMFVDDRLPVDPVYDDLEADENPR